MAKINNRLVYNEKQLLSVMDYFLITDSQDSNRTKSAGFEKVLNLINALNGNSSLVYKFSNEQNLEIFTGTPGYFFSQDEIQNLQNIQRLYFNNLSNQEQDLSSLFQFAVQSNSFLLKLVNAANPNNLVYLKVSDFVQEIDHVHFLAELFNGLGQGILQDEAIYVCYFEFNLTNLFPDAIIKNTNPTNIGNVYTYPALGYKAIINNSVYENTNSFITTISNATVNFKRIDLIYMSVGGVLSKIQGVENDLVAVVPTLPPNTIAIGYINVFGTIITTPTPSFGNTTKLDKGGYSGTANDLSLDIENTKIDLEIHSSNTSNPHNTTKSQVGLGDVNNTSDINKPVSTAQATANALILSTANSYTDAKVSTVYKFKGSVANFASLPSSGQVVGDVWNLTDTGMNYVWTGTLWDALGTTVDISNKQDKNILITTTTTATKSSKYIAIGTFTITDFASPVQGDEYEVFVRNGEITIGGTIYKAGTLVKRIYDATWKSYVYRQQLPIKISTGVTGTYDIDPTISDEFSLTLTGNTQLNFPNFSTVFSDVLSGNVSGNFGVTYEAGTKVAGSYIGTATLNIFAVKKTNGVVTISWTNYL